MDPIVRTYRDVDASRTGCGTLYAVTTRDDFTGGNVAFVVADAPSDPHVHKETTEFYVIVEGTGSISLDGRTHRLDAHAVVMIPPETVHTFAPEPGATLTFWVFSVPAWREDDEFLVNA